MTYGTERPTNSVRSSGDINTGETPIHPTVGLVGVSAIGGFLGAIVGGPVGAIVCGTVGAVGASLENIKQIKTGYYSSRSGRNQQSTSSSSAIAPDQVFDSMSARNSKDNVQAKGATTQAADDPLESISFSTPELAATVKLSADGPGNHSTKSSQSAQAIKGVLLDIDGTLVLSNDAHAHAWVEAFDAFGYEVQFEKIRPLIGMGGDQIVPQMVPELSGNEGVGKQIAARRKELIITKLGSSLSPTPGSRELVLKLKQEGLQIVIASSATSEELSTLLQAAQVDDLLSQEPATTSSDADNSKPAPDLVEAALSKAQLQPEEVLMLGDTPYDIQAASAAGVGVIAFRSGGFDDAQLEGAAAIYDSPADLVAQYDQSPLKQGKTAPISQ